MFSKDAQPFILAGSGTLTWDMTAANLIEQDEKVLHPHNKNNHNIKVLVIVTGIFGDWFAECFEVYGANVTLLKAPFGSRPSFNTIKQALQDALDAGSPYKLVSITQVDTSTGVLNDVKEIASICTKVSPNTLISVDGVCSLGGENVRFDEWGVDVAMTASQKALGTPPGLAIMLVSQRALVN